ENARILAPTKVRLVYKETPVIEAVADIAKKTGFQIQLVGDTSKLADRKVTIDTGETTFWQAFDQFCEKAGLVEAGAGGRTIPVDERPLFLPPVKRGPANPVPAKPAEKKAPAEQEQKDKVKQQQAQAIEVKVAAAAAAGRVQVVQVPAQGGAAPALQIGRVLRTGYRPYNPNRILLMEGKADKLPTCYAGAVRIRALPLNTPAAGLPAKEGEKLVILEASPEPKLQWQFVQGVRIEKAVDDNGQQLEQSITTAGQAQTNEGIAGAI